MKFADLFTDNGLIQLKVTLAPFMFALPVALATLICSCTSTYYGLVRRAELNSIPSFECMAATLSSIAEIRVVQATKFGPANTVFLYSGSQTKNISASLSISQDRPGVVLYIHSSGLFDVKVPQVQIDATRPVMLSIERRLVAECGLIPSSTNVSEICRGVSC